MSFKDDFLEALRSVKRDFFGESEYTDPQSKERLSAPSGEIPTSAPFVPQQAPEQFGASAVGQEPDNAQQFAGTSFMAFEQASGVRDDERTDDFTAALHIGGEDEELDEEDIDEGNITPFSTLEPFARDDEAEPADMDGRIVFDTGDNGNVYNDDKTIISKNTIIRGALQTEDSVRLLGQVLGDIDCKSNIVVAGKVRGNTTAANAYIFDAQVDGDVRCDDVINISNDAWILGNIRAQQAEIDGKVKGNIEIRHMVSIGATSSVLGDISTDELEIKRGAFVNGQIMMYSPSRDVLDRFDTFKD